MSFDKSVRHLIVWDGLYPWLGYLIACVFAWSEDLDQDEYELFFAVLVPIGLCLIRAGVGTRRGQVLSGIARWRVIAHQVLFAVALIVLMIFEFVSEALAFARDEPLSAWLWPFVLQAVYVLLILASKRVINKLEWEHDGVVY